MAAKVLPLGRLRHFTKQHLRYPSDLSNHSPLCPPCRTRASSQFFQARQCVRASVLADFSLDTSPTYPRALASSLKSQLKFHWGLSWHIFILYNPTGHFLFPFLIFCQGTLLYYLTWGQSVCLLHCLFYLECKFQGRDFNCIIHCIFPSA